MELLLHVEDEDATAVLFLAAVKEAKIDVIVFRVSDGEQALEYLRRGALRPDLVFLDLNMPKVDGWEVLLEMNANESLRTIPVVVLSTSSLCIDKDRAKTLGARHYLTKPSTFDGLVAAVGSTYRTLMA
jgi:CheY-like chemotaxis protein